jgi:hypothetical protein
MSWGWREAGGPFDADPHELVDVFRGFIGDAVARGEISSTVDASRMGTVLYSSYFGLLYDWCEGSETKPPFDLNDAYTQMLDVFVVGVRAL